MTHLTKKEWEVLRVIAEGETKASSIRVKYVGPVRLKEILSYLQWAELISVKVLHDMSSMNLPITITQEGLREVMAP